MIPHHIPHFHIDTLVLHYVAFWKPVAYLVIFFAMIIEGEIFLFTAGFLASRGILNSEPTFLMLLGGVIFGDWLWYLLGYKINHSDTRFSRWLVKKTGQFDEHLLQSPLRTLFISKFIYGVHHFILARAGVLKLKFSEFVKDDFVANIVWIFIIGGLGYLSGIWFGLAKNYLRFAEQALLAGLILFLGLQFIIGRYKLKQKL